MQLNKEKRTSKRSSTPAVPVTPVNNDEAIVVKGAKVHNLKNIDAFIPRDKFVVITGPSGSGKSSLAFDTIYAEGQRRYVESLSAYARQFLEQLGKPDVESISGLSPTISIEQRTTSYNPRSTVGTVTEIYDYLRLLFARIAKPFCWNCGKPIQSQSPQQIVDQILSYPEATRLSILAPVVRGRKGEYQKELVQLRARGFVRVRIDGEILDLSQDIALDKNKKHDIEVYVDRLIVKGDLGTLGTRVSDSVELALKLGEGQLILEIQEGGKTSQTLMSEKFACPDCQISYPAPEPRTFSFNSPMGACPSCDGLGTDQKAVDQAESEAEEAETDIPRIVTEISPEKMPCPDCHGTRLRKESLHFKIADSNIADVCTLALSDSRKFFDTLPITERQHLIADRILKEIRERLGFLNEVGVGYLNLSRPAQSLSEVRPSEFGWQLRIGSSLVGVIYVLDEPSIGLHQRDNQKLISTLTRLRELGNTVLVVEHDRDTIEAADWILDLGPGAGTLGGKMVVQGTLQDVLKSEDSLTGKYLRGEFEIAVPQVRRPWSKVVRFALRGRIKTT